jgi:hypothetical protein
MTGCIMVKDVQLPEFYEKPTINGITKGINFLEAGDEVIINYKVRDNQAINYIQLFKSTDLNKPIDTIINNYQKNKFESQGYRINLPFDNSKYKLFLVASDLEGNKTFQQVGDDVYFDVRDKSSPKISENFQVSKITDELYKIKFYFEEIGSGIDNFTVIYKDKYNILKKYYAEDNFENETDNYYVIENENSWKQEGYVVFFTNISIGDNTFNIIGKDKMGNSSDSYSFTHTIKSENPDSVIDLSVNYQEYYILDQKTKETDDISINIKASDEISYIKKLEIIENGLKKDIPINPALPNYEYEYKIGKKSSLQTINLKIIAYNTNDSQKEKDISISIIEEKKPYVSFFLNNIIKSGISHEPKEYIINNNVFIESGDQLNFSLKAEDLMGLSNIEVYSVRNFNTETLYTKSFDNNEKEYSEDIALSFVDEGVYKLYLKAVNVNGISEIYEFDKDIVYSDEIYTISNMRLRANFFYNQEIDQNIYYKSVSGKKIFIVSDKTNIEFASEIKSKYQNIDKVYYLLDGVEIPAEKYDSNSLEWRSIDYYKSDIGVTTEYKLQVKVVDTFGKEYVLGEDYYIQVVNTPEDAYGSKSNIFVDNYNPITTDQINISYSIEDDFGIDNYKVELYEITDSGTEVLIKGNPFISIKLDERKEYSSSKDWTPYRTSTYKFKLIVENILGIKTISETKEINVSELYVNIIEPALNQITRRRSQNTINFKVDTSGGATLNVYVEDLEGNKYQIMNRITENDENILTRYDFILNLSMEYPDYSEGTGIVFSKPGEYTLFFEAVYKNLRKKVSKTLLIRDDSDTILDSINIKPDYTGSSTPTDTEFSAMEDGIVEEFQYDNDKYYIPVDYDGANQTRIDIKLKLIDYNILDKVLVDINGNTFNFESPTLIEDITSGENEGKKRFTYEIGIAKENINIGVNNIKIYVEKEIYNEPYKLKELDLVALDWQPPSIDNYDFEISNVPIVKGETSNKYFVLGQHSINFNKISLTDNFGVGGFDLRLFQRDNNNFIDLNKSLYGVMRIRQDQIQSKQADVDENDLKTVFGTNGLDLSNFTFDESIGYYKINVTLYDESYILAMNSSLDTVKNYIKKYNISYEPIYIYLTDNVKAKKLTILPDDRNYIKSIIFKSDLEIELSENLNVEDVIDSNSIEAYLTGPTEINLTNDVSYYGKNVYEIDSTIPEEVEAFDGEYILVVKFKTKYSDKYEEIRKSVILDIDESRNLSGITRKYINGKGNVGFEIEINTIYKENLEYDVDNYYFEYNGVKKQGKLDSENKKAYVDLYGLEDGNYEITFHITDKIGKELISNPLEFTIESNPPVIEGIITDIEDRNRNVLALNTDKNLTVKDDIGLYKTIFTKGNNFFSENTKTKSHILNIETILQNLNDEKSYSDGEYFDLNIDSSDINSNDTYEDIKIYRDTTAPSTVINNGIPSLVTENNKTLKVLVNDNVATKSVDFRLYNNILNKEYIGTMEQDGKVFDVHDFKYVWVDENNNPIFIGNYEGEFTLEVTAEDLAGNKSTMQLPNKIRIDNKNPIIEDFSVLDSINNSSGIYYTNSLTDHVLEWEISDFTINATDGTVDFYVNDVETKEASSTSKNIGSTSLSYLNINTDGSYDIYFKATDEAGLTDESNTYTIVYDSTDPNITKVTADSTILSSSNLNDNIGEDFVKLTIEFEDANPGTYNITYGTNVLNVSDNYSVENDGTGIISINNLEVFDTETDLRIEITDYAGNSTGTITYSLQK